MWLLEFLARILVHVPDNGHMTTRDSGWYSNRPRSMRRRADPAAVGAPAIVPAPRLAPTTRRWVVRLQEIFDIDTLAWPTCRGTMRIVAVSTQRAVIDRILKHRRRTYNAARGPPSPQRPTPRPARRFPRARFHEQNYLTEDIHGRQRMSVTAHSVDTSCCKAEAFQTMPRSDSLLMRPL